MTEPATATSEGLRRIGEETHREGPLRPAGLRRIGDPSFAAPPATPIPAPTPPAAPSTVSLRRIAPPTPPTPLTPPTPPASAAPPPSPPPPSLPVAPPSPAVEAIEPGGVTVEPAASSAPSAPLASERPASGRPPTLLMAAAAALAVILVAAVVVLGLRAHNQDTSASLRSSALSTAKTDGVLLSSYDYRNLTGPGSDWSKVEKAATPAFRRSFLATSGTLGKLLTQYNATATGKVIAAGVSTSSASRAVVALFIDQTVKNTVQKSASSTQPLRSEITLLRQNGRWLINSLQVPK